MANEPPGQSLGSSPLPAWPWSDSPTPIKSRPLAKHPLPFPRSAHPRSAHPITISLQPLPLVAPSLIELPTPKGGRASWTTTNSLSWWLAPTSNQPSNPNQGQCTPANRPWPFPPVNPDLIGPDQGRPVGKPPTISSSLQALHQSAGPARPHPYTNLCPGPLVFL